MPAASQSCRRLLRSSPRSGRERFSRWERSPPGMRAGPRAAPRSFGAGRLRCRCQGLFGQVRGKSGAGGGVLQTGLSSARLAAGASPEAQVGTVQPPRGAGPFSEETARPFPCSLPPLSVPDPAARPLMGRVCRDPYTARLDGAGRATQVAAGCSRGAALSRR